MLRQFKVQVNEYFVDNASVIVLYVMKEMCIIANQKLFVLYSTKIEILLYVILPFCFISLLNKIPSLTLWRHLMNLLFHARGMCAILAVWVIENNEIRRAIEKIIQRFHGTILKMQISILYHVIVTSQLNRYNLTRCYIILALEWVSSSLQSLSLAYKSVPCIP